MTQQEKMTNKLKERQCKLEETLAVLREYLGVLNGVVNEVSCFRNS